MGTYTTETSSEETETKVTAIEVRCSSQGVPECCEHYTYGRIMVFGELSVSFKATKVV